MAKKIVKRLKLLIPAGGATPAPPIGPKLAPHGVSTAQFCQQFNEQTKDMNGIIVPALITIYEDRTFTFEVKTPPTPELIRRELKISKGSATPNLVKVGKLTKEQVRKIAEQKMVDLNTTDIEKAMKTIEGTAKNMGVEIIK